MSVAFNFEDWFDTVCGDDGFEDESTAVEVREYLLNHEHITRPALLHLHVHDFPAEWTKETYVTLLKAIIALERVVANEEAAIATSVSVAAAAVTVAEAEAAAAAAAANDTETEAEDDNPSAKRQRSVRSMKGESEVNKAAATALEASDAKKTTQGRRAVSIPTLSSSSSSSGGKASSNDLDAAAAAAAAAGAGTAGAVTSKNGRKRSLLASSINGSEKKKLLDEISVQHVVKKIDTVVDRDDAVRILEAAYKESQKRELAQLGKPVNTKDLKSMNRFSRLVYLKKFFPSTIIQKDKDKDKGGNADVTEL